MKRDRLLLALWAFGTAGFVIGYGAWVWRKLADFDNQDRVH